MRLRQEQLVFGVTLLVLGAMSWKLFGSDAVALRGRGRSDGDKSLEHYAAPDPAIALPKPDASPPVARALFAPPSDTQPLPALELVEPPREPLPALLPPTDPGPAPRAYARLLRRAIPSADLPELFAEPENADQTTDDEFMGLGEGEDRPKRSLVPTDEPAPDPYADELPAERAERFEGYRRRLDWVQKGPGELWFGRIENEDRYGLEIDPERASEPILFVRIDPDTGRETYGNIDAPPIPIERNTIGAFGFAATVSNEIESAARRIGKTLTRGSFDPALALARRCIEVRHEAPRALEIAEELFRMCAEYDPKDPLPRLGLARCLEAGFRFEDAFNEYQSLLETFGHREEVHVRLAQLEERFLLFDQAEERLRHALSMNQASWVSNFGLGSFLARRGGERTAEAVEHLRAANRAVPADPDMLSVRVAVRTDLADAHFALGEVEEAQAMYRSALSADPENERARAGVLATGIFAPEGTSGTNGDAEDAPEGATAGFDVLLARGVSALAKGEHVAARDALRRAALADPLRAHEPLAALSILAENTGNLPEAARFVEEALERDPTSPYALYQRGRLLGLQDDYEGARASLLAALEQELEFEDALVSLGEMAFRLGRFEDAERYLERAVALEGEAGGRAEVHALRGLNFLRLSSVADARAEFERALALEAGDPEASAGLAWCIYLEGNPEEALVQLADIDDRRRSEPEDDPWRVWARGRIAALQDHLQKVEWRDSFDRKRLLNGWQTRESAGPQVSLEDGAAMISGQFTKVGDARIYREYPAGLFVSLEASVWIEPGKDSVRAGIFAARERVRKDASEVIVEASVARHKEGGLQLGFTRSGQPPRTLDMRQTFPTGRWVRLKIERTGESAESAVTISMDGVPLIENEPLASLGQTSSPILVGLFVEGETGRAALVKLDDVSVVYRVGP